MKGKKGLSSVLVILGILVMTGTEVKARFSCGGRIVDIGDSTYEVLSKCGEPNYRDIYFNSETWIYDFGPHKFIRILTFVHSRLFSIKKGEYGTIEGRRLREELGP